MTSATDPAFLQFLAAIRQQESQGNYSARSAAGAVGAYQVMPNNVGPWSAAALGHSVSVAEFAASPTLQDEVASFELLKYYNAYGARGAAAAWYAGDPRLANDYTVDRWGQSPGGYADEVLSKVGTAPAVGATDHGWATPGHWVGAAGQPIPDPPVVHINYNDPRNGGGPTFDVKMADAKANWTDEQWTALIGWLIAYGGSSEEHGPTLAKLHPPYSSNDKGFVFDLFAHTVTTQAKGKEFNPSTGEAVPGVGPIGNPLAGLEKLLQLLASGGFWKRVGLGALGVAIIVGMVLWLQRGNIAKAVSVV